MPQPDLLDLHGSSALQALTVGGTLARAADRFADRPALIYDGREATYAELFAQVVERARSLVGLG
ncbi:hypothetical protein ACFSLT_21935 [Novosphingobium resinovorum]